MPLKRQHSAELLDMSFWAELLHDAPVGAEPSLLVDFTGGEARRPSMIPLLMPDGLDERTLLAAFALILARASAHPEPTGKELLIGVPLVQPDSETRQACLMPVPFLVDETRPFHDLVKLVCDAIEVAAVNALPETELRSALRLAKTDRVVCATFIGSAAAEMAQSVLTGWSPDVQLQLHASEPQAMLVVAGQFDPLYAVFLADRLRMLVDTVAGARNTRVSVHTPMRQVSLLTSPERELLLHEWTPRRQHYAGMDRTFHELLSERPSTPLPTAAHALGLSPRHSAPQYLSWPCPG